MGKALLPAVVGHRGAAAAAPENTLESLRLAAEQGAAMVEFDVKLTADGALILMHDDALDRTTTGHGAVAATRAGRYPRPRCRRLVRRCLARRGGADPGGGHRPPGGMRPERQYRDQALSGARGRDRPRRWSPACAGTGRQARPRPLLSSFARDSLAAARDEAPEIPRGLLLWGKPADWSAAARSLDCASVHCAAEDMTPEWAAEIGRLGYGLAVYTVNDPDLAAAVARLGRGQHHHGRSRDPASTRARRGTDETTEREESCRR